MSYQTHTPAEWAEVLFLATGITSSGFVPVLLFAGARLSDFDPRPLLARTVESGRLDPVLCAVANAKHDAHAAVYRARLSVRDAAVSVAALLMLLTATPGDTR